jgi:replication factor C small subunit
MPTIAKNFSNLMWIEKYSVLTPDQITDHRIRQLVNIPDDMPHLLFTGPAGVGKTATALCIAQQLLKRNKKNMLEEKLPLLIHRDRRRDISELSITYDESGFKMVRVKDFVDLMKVITTNEYEKHFRIIIIDDADEMTSEAQTDLIRIIEDSSKITRFIIICNYLSSIIEPLQSRCMVFQFTKLTREDAVRRLKTICEKEGVRFEEKALLEIYEAASGNLRHSINILQAAAGMGSVSQANVIVSVALSVRSKVGEVIRLALDGKFTDAMAVLFELTNEFGIPENNFLKYTNQEYT